MKVKVDEKEYLDLIKRVERLERAIEDRQGFIFRSWEITEERLYRMMEQYFDNRTRDILFRRDRDKIIGELRKVAMNNIFKEVKNEQEV